MNPLQQIKKRIEENLLVLIVDDEPQIISALRRELRKESFALETFTDPSKALEAIRKKEYALIISDKVMPGMTGLELLSKASEILPVTRRFLLTGTSNIETALQAIEEGIFHRFITKPWDRAELISSIHEALNEYIADKLSQEAERLGNTLDQAES